MSNQTLTTRGLSLVASAVVALAGLVAFATPSEAYVRSDTVTMCIDGPNHLGQSYPVDCTRLQGFESDDVCQYNADDSFTCSDEPAVDSTTICLYQYDYGTNPDNGTNAVKEYWSYEIGLCAPRGDTVDPSPNCITELHYFDGRKSYLTHNCPDFNTPTPTPTPPPIPPTLTPTTPPPVPDQTVISFKRINLDPSYTKLVVSVTTPTGTPLKNLSMNVCVTDLVTKGNDCSATVTGNDGTFIHGIARPEHGLTVAVSHAGTARTQPGYAEQTYSVQTETKAKAAGGTLVVASHPQVRTTFRVEKRVGSTWKVVEKLRSSPKGQATIKKLRPGTYRVFAVGAQGRLSDYSNTVTVRAR